MFCPKCKYEYEKNIKACPDCGSKLEEALAPEPETGTPFESAKLYDVSDEIEGGALMAMLESEGIECFLRSNTLPHTRLSFNFIPKDSSGPSFASVMVNKEKINEAKEVLDDFKKGI